MLSGMINFDVFNFKWLYLILQGLKQPEPNSEAAKAAAFCFQWKKSLLIHRAQEQLNPETDDLGLRRTSQHSAAPSLAPPLNVLENYKRVNMK